MLIGTALLTGAVIKASILLTPQGMTPVWALAVIAGASLGMAGYYMRRYDGYIGQHE